MGKYMVNGEVVDVPGASPTASDLKQTINSLPNDWVMAAMPTGQVVQLNDRDPLPTNADSYSVVAAYEYGS